jgi:hypothetical protein
MFISNQQSAIGNRKSAIPANLGQAMTAEILRKKRRSLELVLQKQRALSEFPRTLQ